MGRKRVFVADGQFQTQRKTPEALASESSLPQGIEALFRRLRTASGERVQGPRSGHGYFYPHGRETAQTCSEEDHGNEPVVSGRSQTGQRLRSGTTSDSPLHLVARHKRRLGCFDEEVILMFTCGMSMREIQARVLELYALDLSTKLVADITQAPMLDAVKWQSRALEPAYPLVFFDCLQLIGVDGGALRNETVCLALGVLPNGSRDVLGIWAGESEGASFWADIRNDLAQRGIKEISMAVVNGSKHPPDREDAALARATMRTDILHLIRGSLKLVGWPRYLACAAALREIYTASSASDACLALEAFEESGWGMRDPEIAKWWRLNWERVIPFFSLAPEIRRILYTMEKREILHMDLRKIIR